jgi:aspartate 1-decarboxylase
VISYADYDQSELDDFEPTIVHVDRGNRIITEELASLEARVDHSVG